MRRSTALLFAALAICTILWAAHTRSTAGAQPAVDAPHFEVDAPGIHLNGAEFSVRLRPSGQGWSESPSPYQISIDGQPLAGGSGRLAMRDEGALRSEIEISGLHAPQEAGAHRLSVSLGGAEGAEMSLRVIPGWLSLLPPLLAILLAIAMREVLVALAAGIWLGASVIHDYNPLIGLLRVVDTYAAGALADADHASIVLFSLLLGGMIGVIARSGGALGLAQVVTRFAKTRFSGALSTWVMGLLIFFDDYSNSLLVGTTMRPITDKLQISREKLAFLVDATAAPVASFALVSSWVGVEVGYISAQYSALGIEGDPYMVFLESIPYRFYPILMLFFGLMLIVMRRDFGPMLKAERRALNEGKVSADGANPASDFEAKDLLPDASKKPHYRNALLPIILVIVTAMVGMYLTGEDNLTEAREAATLTVQQASAAFQGIGVEPGQAQRVAAEAELAEAQRALGLLDINLRNIFGKADSLKALLWAALLGGLLAVFLSVGQRILTVREAMEAWVAGVRSITLAVMILVLAWALGQVCAELHTAQFVIQAIGSWLSPTLLPAVVFVIAALVSFATGTSWGTMGILFPLVIPLAYELSPEDSLIVLSSVASILSGSVWGDHCSPISDTTIMSSMATSCDHVDHVRTQLPYALAVGLISLVVGELGTGLGLWGPWVGLTLGALVIVLLVRFVGRPLEEPSTPVLKEKTAR